MPGFQDSVFSVHSVAIPDCDSSPGMIARSRCAKSGALAEDFAQQGVAHLFVQVFEIRRILARRARFL